MATEELVIQSDSEKLKQLDSLANQMDTSRELLVNEAIDQLLDLYNWQAERIREGIEAADSGNFVSEKVVESIFSKYAG